MKLTVKIGPDMNRQDVYVALGEIADMLKGIRVSGLRRTVSSTKENFPEGCDAHISEAIQAVFAAQRTMESNGRK
jgi:hypothetical protein